MVFGSSTSTSQPQLHPLSETSSPESSLANRFCLYSMSYHGIQMFREDPSKPTALAAAISVGWGIGASMALIMQAPALFSALGPADLPAPACPSVSAFHIQALMTLPTALLHILLTVIVFDAYPRKSWLMIGLSAFLHFVAAFAVRKPIEGHQAP